MGAGIGAVKGSVACPEIEPATIGMGGAFNLDDPRFFRRLSSLLRAKALLDRCWALGKPVDAVPEGVLGAPAGLTLDPGFLSKTEPTMAPGTPRLLIVIGSGVVYGANPRKGWDDWLWGCGTARCCASSTRTLWKV